MSKPKPITIIHTGKEFAYVDVCSHISIGYAEVFDGQLNSGYDEIEIKCNPCMITYPVIYYIGD